VAARGDHIHGSRGHILIEHDVVAHDDILKEAADKTNPGKWRVFCARVKHSGRNRAKMLPIIQPRTTGRCGHLRALHDHDPRYPGRSRPHGD
jgi:hypothetical protein